MSQKKLHRVNNAPQLCSCTSQSHAVFSKMFRKNCLHDKGQCLNMAIKFSSFYSWQVHYLKIKLPITAKSLRQICDRPYKESLCQASFPELRENQHSFCQQPSIFQFTELLLTSDLRQLKAGDIFYLIAGDVTDVTADVSEDVQLLPAN